MKFDQILLENARTNGVDVREERTVNEVIEDGGRVAGSATPTPTGCAREIRARYVVDASGNTSRIHTPGRRQAASTRSSSATSRCSATSRAASGCPRPTQGNILAVAFSSGWFWYIPLIRRPHQRRRGAVAGDAPDRVQGDPERALRELIAECPMIADFLSDASGSPAARTVRSGCARTTPTSRTKFWRPGLVLVGDAACFIDPVFSSGVHLATYSALLAARSINTALRAATWARTTLFEEFEARYRQEYSRFYEFLVAFYDMHSDEQSYFWKAKKVTGNTATEAQSFVDLVGGGSSDERALIDVDTYIERQGRDVDELAWSVAQAGASIQMQAETGGVADEQEPVRPTGWYPPATVCTGRCRSRPQPDEAAWKCS